MLEPDEQLRPYCRDTAAAMSVACCLARASHTPAARRLQSTRQRSSRAPTARTYRVSDITQAKQDRLPWGGVCGRGGKANGHVSAPRGKGPASAALTSEQQLS